MAKFNAAWWWIDRWRKSTAYVDMTLAEQGAYRNLLDELWLRGGALPKDERKLAKISGDPLEWPNVRKAVMERFYDSPEGWKNETHDEVFGQSRRRAEKQRRYRERKGNAPGNTGGNAAGNKPGSPSPSPSPDQSPTPEPSPKEDREPSAPSSRSRAASRDIDAVIAHYRHHHPRSKPGAKERKLIAARLNEGWAVEDLQGAIDGNHRDPHCCGENDRGKRYHRLALIFRDADQVQHYLDVPEITLNPKTQERIRAGQNWLKLTGGNHDA